jgi:hypothetical protein
MKVRIYFMLLILLIANIYPISGFSQCTLGTEKVNNGGFEPTGSVTLNPSSTAMSTGAGIPGFTSPNYTFYDCPNTTVTCCALIIQPGKYALVKNDAEYCYSGFLTSGIAHSGSYAAVFDGTTAANSTLWCQSVSGLNTAATYAFTAWYLNVNTGNSHTTAEPSIQMTIDYGSGPVALGTAATAVSGAAYSEAGCFTTPTATSATICLTMLSNGNSSGNDVAIDDISFRPVTGGAGCSAGSCVYSTTPVTPVNLVSFTAREKNTRAALEWITASEQNSSYFSIEKATDAVYFTDIGSVNARGNSSNQITYGFEDNRFNETSYYRLKMVDIDGSIKYSAIIMLKKDEYARFINFSEDGQLKIKAVVNEDTEWNISVFSLLGQQYLNENIRLVKGENMILKGISGGEQSAKIIRITGVDGAVILSEVVVW